LKSLIHPKKIKFMEVTKTKKVRTCRIILSHVGSRPALCWHFSTKQGADLRKGALGAGAPGKKKKKLKFLSIFAGKFCIIVNLIFGETEEGEERLESEFF
jgi:hypothetical protein